MGEVYRARDTRLDRTVAIKVISGLAAGTNSAPRRRAFDDRFPSTMGDSHTCYDVTADGQRFVMVSRAGGLETIPPHVNIILGWLARPRGARPATRYRSAGCRVPVPGATVPAP